MNAFWIKGVGLLLLLMMAVRVSVTPGVRHRHEHGHHSHSHQHHSHGSHSHAHEPAETTSSVAHVHVFFFGWEFVFSSPFSGEDDSRSPAEHDVAQAGPFSEIETSPLGPMITTAAGKASLIQWVFDLKSPAPPTRLGLPGGLLSSALCENADGDFSRDRDKPRLPPPKGDVASPAANLAAVLP